jgi:hypothetical protein
MADKKITPMDPAKESAKKADDKTSERKTAGMKFPRKTGRKSSGLKKFH